MHRLFRSYRQLIVLGGLLAGLWSWLLTIRVAQISSATTIGYATAWTAYLVILALSVTSFVLAIRYLRRRHRTDKPWQSMLRVWVVWAAAELATSWLVAVVWMGRDGSWDTVLPFGSLTPLIMYTPLAYLTRLVGYYGLSALCVAAVYCVASKKTRHLAPAVLGGIVVLTVVAWGVYRVPSGEPVQAVIVAETLTEHVPVIQTDADLVVFPEYGLDGIDSPTLNRRVAPTNEQEVYVVGSQQLNRNGGIRNILMFGSTSQGFLERVPKTRLIPAGEYLPYIIELPLKAFKQQSVLDMFAYSRAVVKGDKAAEPLRIRDGVVLGSEACASIISTDDYRRLTVGGATVLTNSASLGIFNSWLFNLEHKGLAKFMAVANARPLLQAASSSAALALDHNGRELAHIQPQATKQLEIYANSRWTPYTFLGEWVAYAGVVVIVLRVSRTVNNLFARPGLAKIRKKSNTKVK